jgi:hypothetical protein
MTLNQPRAHSRCSPSVWCGLTCSCINVTMRAPSETSNVLVWCLSTSEALEWKLVTFEWPMASPLNRDRGFRPALNPSRSRLHRRSPPQRALHSEKDELMHPYIDPSDESYGHISWDPGYELFKQANETHESVHMNPYHLVRTVDKRTSDRSRKDMRSAGKAVDGSCRIA